MYYNNILEVIGNTPLVKINKLNPNPRVTMLALLEMFNPGGSIKDRIGPYMIEEGVKSGKLRKGGTIIESTGAGNTGIGLAIAANILGYKCILTIPDKVSDEKRNMLRALGARLVVAPTSVSPDDPKSYYSVAARLNKEIPNSYYPDQFSNPGNPRAHFETTGPQIWEQTEGKVTHVVMTIGTWGTVVGVSRFLKRKNRKIKIIAVDHIGSVFYPYYKTGKMPKGTKSYYTEGFGEDIMPKNADFSVIDDMYQLDDKECFLAAREFAKKEGILTGSSSGAALFAARKLVRKLHKGLVVVVMPDSGTKYLSKFYNDDWMRDFGFLEETDESIRPLLNKKLHLITVADTATPQQAINLLRKYNISQMPVVNKQKKIVGTICEKRLIQNLFGKSKIPVSVSEIMDREFIELPETAGINQMAAALKEKEMIIIIDKRGKAKDVLTRIDLLSHMTD